MRIKSLAQEENILMLGNEPSTFVSKVDILTTIVHNNELEKTDTAVVDIFNIMADLRNKLRSRYVEEFCGYQAQQQFKNLGIDESRKTVEDYKSFLTFAITYLENRIDEI